MSPFIPNYFWFETDRMNNVKSYARPFYFILRINLWLCFDDWSDIDNGFSSWHIFNWTSLQVARCPKHCLQTFLSNIVNKNSLFGAVVMGNQMRMGRSDMSRQHKTCGDKEALVQSLLKYSDNCSIRADSERTACDMRSQPITVGTGCTALHWP